MDAPSETPICELIEYRIKPVPRFMVTRYARWTDGAAEHISKGVFDNEDTAFEVGYALAKHDHEMQGWPVNDERIQYPVKPSEAATAPAK